MKEWSYYDKPKNVEYYGYDYQESYKRDEIKRINDTKLTVSEREVMLINLKQQIREHMRELNEPYNAACRALTAEFWEDARQELGYHLHLTPEGISKLESKAYEEGHAYGYSEVYHHLRELWGFFTSLASELSTWRHKLFLLEYEPDGVAVVDRFVVSAASAEEAWNLMLGHRLKLASDRRKFWDLMPPYSGLGWDYFRDGDYLVTQVDFIG